MAQQPKVVNVGPGRGRGPRPKVANPGKILKRILAYVMHLYKLPVIAVLCCICLSVFAQVQGTLFMKTLIDGYITPMLVSNSTDFSGLVAAITRVALFYAIGIAAIFVQNRLMARITQGTLKNLRDEMFTHMQTLPIKYFDTHAHGDIMSIYTNDTDTLRQMISQSMPQLINTGITVVSVLVSMIVLSPALTVVALFMVGVMLLCTKFLTSRSGKFFVSQQRELGRVNELIKTMKIGELNHFIRQQREKGSDMIGLFEVERHTRYAYPISTFILTLIGVSLSSRKVRGGTGLHIGIGITLCFSYILFGRFFEEFAKSGVLPAGFSVWIPNLIYLVIAVFLYRNAPK